MIVMLHSNITISAKIFTNLAVSPYFDGDLYAALAIMI